MATLTYGLKSANAVDLTIAPGAGETEFQIEANRSRDFDVDESLIASAITGTAFTFPDLVEDTPYYFRVRKTNGGNGPWSAALMTATAPGSARVPYTGFSIEPAILVVPEPIVDMTAAGLDAGSLPENLLNDDPMSTARFVSPGSIVFRTSGRPVDVFSLLGTTANEAMQWRIRGATSQAGLTSAPTVDTGSVSMRVNPGIGRRRHYHAYRRLSQAYGLDWWRIDVSGFSRNLVLRHLVVGLARQSVNVSRGQGHSVDDRGTMSRNLFGVPDRVRGWRGRQVEFPLSWLREAEYEAKWSDLDHLVGTTGPVLALPNPKLSSYLNDRIAYGTLREIRTENMRGDRYGKTLTIDSLY